MSDNKDVKYFHCQSCRHVWKTSDYLSRGDEAVSTCPICDKAESVIETSYRVLNLYQGWDKATGPKTEEGKARVALNGWKTGRYASQFRMMAPAKPGKYPICVDCQYKKECKEKPFTYCPHDLETMARFVQAYKEGKVNDLRELAGLVQGQVHKVFTNIIHHILENGVMFKNKKPAFDKDGNLLRDDDGKIIYTETFEKNNLIKDIPAFVQSMGFSAELQDMTPKTRQESDAIKGYLDDTKTKQEDIVQVKRAAMEEMTRMREAVEKMTASDKMKKFKNEQTADPPGKSSGE